MRYMIYSAAMLLIAVAGCKKEYEQAPRPYSDIHSFTVAYGNAGADTINAIFTTDTVTVIWPAETEWPMPDSIAPQITLTEGATITPASGAKVKFATGSAYTVKAEDGSTRKYVLKVVVGGAVPFFLNIPATPQTRLVGSMGNVSLGNLRGTINENKMILVADNGTEYELVNRLISATNGSFITDTKNGTGIPAGSYFMKIVNRFNLSATSSSKMVTIADDSRVPYAYPNNTAIITVKAGETFTVPVRHVTTTNVPTEARIYYYAGEYITPLDMEIVEMSNNNTMITIRVPAGTEPLTSVLQEGLVLRGPFGQSFSPAMEFPIQVVE